MSKSFTLKTIEIQIVVHTQDLSTTKTILDSVYTKRILYLSQMAHLSFEFSFSHHSLVLL
jgi:hypothetical protein